MRGNWAILATERISVKDPQDRAHFAFVAITAVGSAIPFPCLTTEHALDDVEEKTGRARKENIVTMQNS